MMEVMQGRSDSNPYCNYFVSDIAACSPGCPTTERGAWMWMGPEAPRNTAGGAKSDVEGILIEIGSCISVLLSIVFAQC